MYMQEVIEINIVCSNEFRNVLDLNLTRGRKISLVRAPPVPGIFDNYSSRAWAKTSYA